MFSKMPFVLAIVICAVIFLNPFIPLTLQQILYSTSANIKELITFFLPFVIFALLFKSAVMLSSKASQIIGLIIALICCSNFCSTFLSHYVGMMVYNFDLSMALPKSTNVLEGLWQFSLPKIVANTHAMFGGIILGFLASKLCRTQALKLAIAAEHCLSKILSGFTYLIPVFVAGFVVKMQHDGVMKLIIKDYAGIFVIVALAQFFYILLSYLILNNFSIAGAIKNLQNMMPAAISGFSSMSSAASMPLTLLGVEQNVRNKDIARSVVPASVNIHLVGDCFAIPIFAYAVLKSFGMPEPSLMNYLIFAFYFVMAKFSVAAIPGGGIIVMLPILQSYLGFNGDMMSLITALYILFDPVITCANVLGNGAFAKIIDKVSGTMVK